MKIPIFTAARPLMGARWPVAPDLAAAGVEEEEGEEMREKGGGVRMG